MIPDTFEVDAKASITLRVQRFQAREQAFYGLGPSSSLSGLAGYGLRQNDATLSINNPLFSWISVGFSHSISSSLGSICRAIIPFRRCG